MQRLTREGLMAGLLASLVLLLELQVCRAQEKKKNSKEVKFETADKVELHGSFYPGQGAQDACVILLHKLGGDRQKGGWDELATNLQEQKGYTVLAIDFRGHGESTKLADMQAFWRVPANSSFVGGRGGQKIDHKFFSKAYLPMLVNDVAAAKQYLDQQNNNKVCNSSNVIVIGAEEGAVIGMLWMSTAWQRKRWETNQFNKWMRTGPIEGKDIACGVWLSASDRIGNLLAAQCLVGGFNKQFREEVPMLFLYGQQDTKAATTANTLLGDIKRSTREMPQFTAAREIKTTKASGADLLGNKTLDVEAKIGKYLENVMEKRALSPSIDRPIRKEPEFVPLNKMYGLPLP